MKSIKTKWLGLSVLTLSVVLVGSLSCGGGGVVTPDLDLDSVLDGSDNCPDVANLDQADLDGDGLGNACDTDADGDGALATAGDCDDLNASAKPGVEDNPDTNLQDLNCDGTDGDLTKAIWVAGDGNDATGDGSIGNPFRTIKKGADQAVLDTSKDVYVANGTFDQTAVLELKGVRLFGGYGALSGTVRPRDPVSNVSLVTYSGPSTLAIIGMMTSVTSHDSVIAGFQIQGTDLTTSLITLTASSQVEGNVLTIAPNTGNNSFGVLVVNGSADIDARVSANQITVGATTGVNGHTVGIFGLNLNPAANLNLTAQANVINVGSAVKLSAGIFVTGMASTATVSLTAESNDITTSYSRYSLGISAGLDFLGGSGDPTNTGFFTQAKIHQNILEGDYINPSSKGTIGVALNQSPLGETSVISNNLIIPGLAFSPSAVNVGIFQFDGEVDILNNTLISDGNSKTVKTIFVRDVGFFNTKVRVINNLFGWSAFAALPPNVALFSDGVGGEFIEVDNNLFDPNYSVLLQNPGMADVLTLTDLNLVSFAENNLEDTPQFVDAPNLNYHLASSSAPGVNAGQALSSITIDIDGQSRSDGQIDIGADEVSP